MVYIADKAEIDAVFQRTLVTLNGIHVGSCQAQGIDTTGLQTRHEAFVDQAAIDHRHHFEHFCVRDAPSIDHSALDSECAGNLCGPATSAMYEDFMALDGHEVF